MDNILFEDDMKEYKSLSFALLAISILAEAALVVNSCVENFKSNSIRSVIIAGIIVGAIFCYSVYFALYVARNKAIVTDNNICVKSLFGNKNIELTKEIVFERKKYNAKYDIFHIYVGEDKLTLKTKKSEELARILQQYVVNSHI